MVSIIKNILLKPFINEKSSLEDTVANYLQATTKDISKKNAAKEKLANSIFDNYYLSFKRYFEFSTKNSSIAEELTQDTLLKIYRSLESYQPDKAQFKTWAWTIAKNHFRDYLRSNARKEDNANKLEIEGTYFDTDADQISEPWMQNFLVDDELNKLIKHENNRTVTNAIALLSEKNRDVLLSWLESDLSMDELAQVHDMSVQQIKNHLFQSKKKLKEILRENKHENS